MKLAVLFSGGKDSTLAMYKVMNEVVCLISIISENPESYMFHVPNIHLTELQAKAINLPLIKQSTKGKKEEELEDLKTALIKAKETYKIDGIVTGAVKSVYQASRIQKLCNELNLKCINPLWQYNQIKLLNELVNNNFKVLISGIFAYPLKEELLGKIINKDIINQLEKLQKEFQLNPAGEGGEIETTVLDAPFFKKKIEVTEHETKYDKYAGTYKIKKAILKQKP